MAPLKKKTAVSKKAAKKTQKKTTAKTAKKTAKKVVEKKAASSEKISDRIVTITGGKSCKLSSLCGKKGMVLYFYPKDMTPGCTTESCDFRDHNAVLKKLGYAVVGISPDSVQSHGKFTDKHELDFPLIADTERVLCTDLGVWGEKKLYGRTYMGVSRTTFVFDKKLNIISVYEKVKVAGHVERLIEDLR